MALKFFADTRTGEIQSRLANDVGGVQSVLSDTAATVLSNITIVLSTLAAMIVMDWRLTLLSVGILPLFAFIGARVGELARGVRSTVQTRLAGLSATMQETLSVSGVLLTKTSGRQGLALEKFSDENEALTDAQIKQAMIMRLFYELDRPDILADAGSGLLAGRRFDCRARRHASVSGNHCRLHDVAGPAVLPAHRPAECAGGGDQRPGPL